MQIKEQTTKEYFNSITIIHLALIMGQLLFGAITFYLHSTGEMYTGDGDLNDIFQIVVPLFIGGAIMASVLLTKNRIASIKKKATIKEKLGEYRTFLIIKFALLEAPGLFALICYLLTANYMYLALAGFVIIIFALNKPSKAKLVEDLELDREERSLIDDPKAIVAEIKLRN